ncbi:hypothetical protein [Nocardia jejuensis]|uniref:hypothetical protein n=1 Tax=Nocardia jejuensis TaxID=328049 RepID=UPI000AE194E0|nr:hypothetical protein [Nocardia jejuensis]
MTSAQRLLAEILGRYGTVDAFLARLRRALDEAPTIEFATLTPWPEPAWAEPTTRGRHRRTDSD